MSSQIQIGTTIPRSSPRLTNGWQASAQPLVDLNDILDRLDFEPAPSPHNLVTVSLWSSRDYFGRRDQEAVGVYASLNGRIESAQRDHPPHKRGEHPSTRALGQDLALRQPNSAVGGAAAPWGEEMAYFRVSEFGVATRPHLGG